MSLDYAREVALRSTCPARLAGAVLVARDGAIATGYEGAARGQGHCDVLGCAGPLHGDITTCIRAVPAELNAIIEAARRGIGTVGATLFLAGTLVAEPEREYVIGAIINAGITKLVASDPLASSLHALLENAGIQVHSGD